MYLTCHHMSRHVFVSHGVSLDVQACLPKTYHAKVHVMIVTVIMMSIVVVVTVQITAPLSLKLTVTIVILITTPFHVFVCFRHQFSCTEQELCLLSSLKNICSETDLTCVSGGGEGLVPHAVGGRAGGYCLVVVEQWQVTLVHGMPWSAGCLVRGQRQWREAPKRGNTQK